MHADAVQIYPSNVQALPEILYMFYTNSFTIFHHIFVPYQDSQLTKQR